MNKKLVLAAAVALAISTSAVAQTLKFVQACDQPARHIGLEQIDYADYAADSITVVSRTQAVFGCFNREPVFHAQPFGYRLTGLRTDDGVIAVWKSKSGNGRYSYPTGEESVSFMIESGMDMTIYLVRVPKATTTASRQ